MPKIIDLNDTIVAISTPLGEGGIGMVRMSGKNALKIADKVFRSKDKEKPSQFKTYTTHYGHIIDKNQIIDEIILTVMRSPKSYTKEDIVEINCHSGIVPLRKVLELVIKEGGRLAQPGEFTKRAFLNGRIDLAQAEAVLDVIKAKTDSSLKVAIDQLKGSLSEEITKIRENLLQLYAHIEACIDFPEENVEILSNSDMLNNLKRITRRLKQLIDTADNGKVLRDGITTVICGKPNVGKSSLMNAFLRENRVIVSHIPGTTRDTIEELVNIRGIPLKIVDTAGIMDSDDHLTKEGVVRSRTYIKTADLVLFLLDASEELHDRDLAIMEEVKDKKTIVVINKTDLPKKLDTKKINNHLHDKKVIEISVEKNKNLEKLEKAVTEMVWHGKITPNNDPLITNVRHKNALVSSYESLNEVIVSLENKLSPELVAINMREGIDKLGEVIGQMISEDILDRIFSEFCIGK